MTSLHCNSLSCQCLRPFSHFASKRNMGDLTVKNLSIKSWIHLKYNPFWSTGKLKTWMKGSLQCFIAKVDDLPWNTHHHSQQLTCARNKKFTALVQTMDTSPQSKCAIHNPQIQSSTFQKWKKAQRSRAETGTWLKLTTGCDVIRCARFFR